MAVTKLVFINITGGIGDFDRTLERIIAHGDFHLEDACRFNRELEGVGSMEERNPYADALRRAREIQKMIISVAHGDDKNSEALFTPARSIDAIDFGAQRAKLGEYQAELDGYASELSGYISKLDEYKAVRAEYGRVAAQLNHLAGVDLPLEELFDLEFFKFRFGRMPRESYNSLPFYSADMQNAFFIPSAIEKREVWGMYFTHQAHAQRIDALFASLNFERVRISDIAHGTPDQARLDLQRRGEQIGREMQDCRVEIAAFEREHGARIRELSTLIEELFHAFALRRRCARTLTAFNMVGYIEKEHADAFCAMLDGIPTVVYDLKEPELPPGEGEPGEAAEEDEDQPPTKLHNFFLFRPFEMFVNMYGTPSYNEFDPTPLISLTYILFFGLMFGDLGQSAVIIVVGLALWFIKKINLGRIMALIGCSGMVFGVLYGSVFGSENIIRFPWNFRPMDRINTTLLIAVAIGMVMICISILVNIRNGIRQRNPLKIIFSNNGLAGLIFYILVLIFALSLFKLINFSIPSVIFIPAAIVLLLVIMFRQPLDRKVRGHKKLIEGGKGDYFIQAVAGMFEVMLAYITNTISFIRIGAFALNHVGMMTVVYLLAGQHNIVVLVIGNLLVMALEGFVVGIQVLRLEFYEIFSRFYEGGGKRFVRISAIDEEANN